MLAKQTGRFGGWGSCPLPSANKGENMPPKYLYRKDDGDRYTRGIDDLYSADDSMMAVPHTWTYEYLMSLGAFTADIPDPVETPIVIDSLVSHVFAISDSIDNNRIPMTILPFAMEELGELATEIAIDFGTSAKPVGKDGVIGEGVDAIICILDIIRKYKPDVTEEDLMAIAVRKCTKWKSKN